MPSRPVSVVLCILPCCALAAFGAGDALARHHEHKRAVKLRGASGAFGRRQGKHASIPDAAQMSLPTYPGLELVSRAAMATADVHGNLGAPAVVVQEPQGTDWLKDRWQAASDMHGTAIGGQHWVKVQLAALSTVLRVRLDWESAFCDDYVLEATENVKGTDAWFPLFDTRNTATLSRRTKREWGQSPGVESKVSLHIVHDLDTRPNNSGRAEPIRWVRLTMRKPAMGWGVSLWQISLWGHCVDVANKCDAIDPEPTSSAEVSAGSGKVWDDSWRKLPWLTQKKYCDGYNGAAFKKAASDVQRGDHSQGALARFLYPLFNEFGTGVGRIEKMLKDTHSFFGRHGLHYVLYAGSLIGALRHKGVIPFDTDADIQCPVAEFAKMWDLRDKFEKEMHCKLQRGGMSFACVGMGFKLDIWPVYETWDEGKPPELGGVPLEKRGLNRPWLSQKYWHDDNMPAQEIIDAETVPFATFEARIPKKARFYLKRLYGRNVLTAVKIWNDDFNMQHCNNCNWSPNSFVIPFADFDRVHKHYVRDQQCSFGCFYGGDAKCA